MRDTRGREVVCFSGFFPKLEFSRGFLYISLNFAVRISEAAMGMERYIFRVQRSSFRVRRSSVGCSVAQKDAE
jgi:hypothetical protein